MRHYSINGKSLSIWYLFNLVIIVVIILTHILTMKCEYWICVVKKASGKVAGFFSSFSIFQVSSNKSADYIYNVENGSF